MAYMVCQPFLQFLHDFAFAGWQNNIALAPCSRPTTTAPKGAIAAQFRRSRTAVRYTGLYGLTNSHSAFLSTFCTIMVGQLGAGCYVETCVASKVPSRTLVPPAAGPAAARRGRQPPGGTLKDGERQRSCAGRVLQEGRRRDSRIARLPRSVRRPDAVRRSCAAMPSNGHSPCRFLLQCRIWDALPHRAQRRGCAGLGGGRNAQCGATCGKNRHPCRDCIVTRFGAGGSDRQWKDACDHSGRAGDRWL